MSEDFVAARLSYIFTLSSHNVLVFVVTTNMWPFDVNRANTLAGGVVLSLVAVVCIFILKPNMGVIRNRKQLIFLIILLLFIFKQTIWYEIYNYWLRVEIR